MRRPNKHNLNRLLGSGWGGRRYAQIQLPIFPVARIVNNYIIPIVTRDNPYILNRIYLPQINSVEIFVYSRYFRFKHTRSIVTSGGLGTMGFGLPAAIGAKIGAPQREVCLFVGDGGFQMNLQELGTIFQSRIPVKIILLNNSFLGMVRQWQELFFDKRYSFAEMTNPDFGAIAQGNGIAYRCVEKRDELETAIHAMKEHPGAFLLEVRVEPEENVFPMVPAGAAVGDVRLE